MVALDDFGAGYNGLGLLANFQPDLIKLDMHLIRGVNSSPARQAIIAGIMSIARTLDIQILAEGVETEDELMVLRSAGINLFQGYLFAKPMTGGLPKVAWVEAAYDTAARRSG